jgi:hypothetical protein
VSDMPDPKTDPLAALAHLADHAAAVAEMCLSREEYAEMDAEARLEEEALERWEAEERYPQEPDDAET